jgi:hypothetical protein
MRRSRIWAATVAGDADQDSRCPREPIGHRLPKIWTMRGFRARTGAPGARLAVAAAAVALFGLLSMHGWGSHAVAHPMAAASQGTTVMTAGEHDGGLTGRAALIGEEAATATTPGVLAHGGQADAPVDGKGGPLTGLCVAVLTALLVGIALAISRRSTRTWRGPLPWWPHFVLVGRDRDPPDLLQLCVIRC